MSYLSLEHCDVLRMLPDRPLNAHKGNVGKILLLCGSRGFTGAAALSAMGALRTGAGLVYLGVPESIYAIEAVKLLEPVVFSLPDKDGMLSENAVSDIYLRMKGMDSLLIGPGLGRSTDTQTVVHAVLNSFDGPIVLDADGINVMAGHTDILRGRFAPTIITPHEGEFSRIGGDTSRGRVAAACKLAQDLGVIVLLKGHETVITDGNQVIINRTGNPGMAVGGSGDVLSGMIVSLLGQGIDPLYAAACAAWLHGKAGDLCAERLGQYGMLPSDMLEVIPRLMK